MIGHFLEVMARAILGALGIHAGPRRLGTCGACYCSVRADDDYEYVLGEIHHAECVRYVRRAAA